MKSRSLWTFGALAIAIASLPALAGGQAVVKGKKVVAKKAWTPPLTPDGHPDIQGVWLSNSATPLERPEELAGRPFLTDGEVAELKKRAERLFSDTSSDYASGDNAFLAAFANVETYKAPAKSTCNALAMVTREFDNRTALIIDPPDGKIPPLTPTGQRRRAAAAAAALRPALGPEDLSNANRCITLGVPRIGGNFGSGPYSYYQIFQNRNYVVLLMEVIHEARIIPLDGRPHLPPSISQWGGDSRGRWEGKTLVVDTTNFSHQSNFMGSAENLHLVERFTRVAPDTLRYEITVDDPTIWTKPWTAMLPLRRTQDQIFEFACHEGNAVLMESMMGAARADEKAAEEAARKR